MSEPVYPMAIPLAFPFEYKGATYTEFTVERRAKAKDLIAAERQPTPSGREAALLASVSNVGFDVVGEMDLADYRSITARTGTDFLSVSGSEAMLGAPS